MIGRKAEREKKIVFFLRMSSRAIKKLLKERGYDELDESTAYIERKEQEMLAKGDQEEEVKEPKANMFDLLMAEEEDQQASSEEEKEAPVVVVETKSKKKKGGKKNKGKATAVKDDLSMEEFEAQLAEIQSQLPSVEPAGSPEKTDSGVTEEQQKYRALLVADPKHLDSEAEIKRVFGAGAVVKTSKTKQRVKVGRRYVLSYPKAGWPPLRGSSSGIHTELQDTGEDKAEGAWFAFRHSPEYSSVQMEFLGAVTSHNADAISALVYQRPYHVDALLQLSEILKQTGGDFGEAAELVERALFAYETGFGPHFSITNGLTRVDYRQVEARPLFVALSRHMQFMARRGCWRTAFEVNKVLLGLDPTEDPYGALLTLDFHALKSKQYQYVGRFMEDWQGHSVEDWPNWSYSRALAEFLMGNKGSMDLLVEAILVFPTVVPVLWSKANVDVDPVVLTHPYFQEPHTMELPSWTVMQMMVQLFVERQCSLYRTPEVARWMQEGLLLALETIARGESEVAGRKERVARGMSTLQLPTGVSRHVLVADMEQMKGGLPESVRSKDSFAFDPLPPVDDRNPYNEVIDMEEGEEGHLARLVNLLRNAVGINVDEDPGTSEDSE